MVLESSRSIDIHFQTHTSELAFALGRVASEMEFLSGAFRESAARLLTPPAERDTAPDETAPA